MCTSIRQAVYNLIHKRVFKNLSSSVVIKYCWRIMSESAFAKYTKKSKKHKKSKKSSVLLNGTSDEKKLLSGIAEVLEDEFKLSSPKQKLPKKKKQRKLISTLANTDNSIKSPISDASTPNSKRIKLHHEEMVNSESGDVEESTNVVSLLNTASSTGEKAKKLLTWMLYPLQMNTFFETHWESQPVHIIRNQANYFNSLLTSKDIDLMLREHPLFFGRNVDVVEYRDGVRHTMNPEGRATPSIVWDAYAQGCSVRILNPQTYNDIVHFVLATLQEYFGTMVGANVYLTPAGSQGFAPHYDDIEAFIIQLEGRKHWKLYKPLLDADNLARVSSKDFSRDQLGPLVFDAVLNAGDIIYFPRGMVHEAKTLPDEHSLHMTISSYQRTCYADLMEVLLPSALQSACETDIEFRRGLPLQYLKHVGVTSSSKQTPERIAILKTVQHLFLKIANNLKVDEAADVLGRKFMHDAMPPVLDLAEKHCSSRLDGDKMIDGKVINRMKISLDTQIRLTRYYACRFVNENNHGILYFSTQNARVYHGEEEQFISVDMEFGIVIEILQLHYPDFVPVHLFPIEEKEKMLDLLMQLWDYGIIATNKPVA